MSPTKRKHEELSLDQSQNGSSEICKLNLKISKQIYQDAEEDCLKQARELCIRVGKNEQFDKVRSEYEYPKDGSKKPDATKSLTKFMHQVKQIVANSNKLDPLLINYNKLTQLHSKSTKVLKDALKAGESKSDSSENYQLNLEISKQNFFNASENHLNKARDLCIRVGERREFDQRRSELQPFDENKNTQRELANKELSKVISKAKKAVQTRNEDDPLLLGLEALEKRMNKAYEVYQLGKIQEPAFLQASSQGVEDNSPMGKKRRAIDPDGQKLPSIGSAQDQKPNVTARAQPLKRSWKEICDGERKPKEANVGKGQFK